MNKLYILIFLILTTLMSCDGRDRIHKKSSEALIENNLFNSFTEELAYYPETYTEIITDTIVNSEYKVHIKFYSDMNSSIVLEEQNDIITYKTHFREFITDIKIVKDNTQIFSEKINKAFLVNQSVFSKTEADQYLVHDFWLESYHDIADGVPILFLDYINPKSKKTRLFQFTFLNGSYSIKEVT